MRPMARRCPSRTTIARPFANGFTALQSEQLIATAPVESMKCQQRPVRTAAKPSEKSKPASYMGGINSRSPILKPHSPSRTKSSPRSAGVSPANGVSDERLQVRQAHQRGFEHPGDAIADGVARLFEQCEAFCVGRTAVPDDFPGREQQSLSPVVAGEQSGSSASACRVVEIVAME